jgi:hypothetical protein
MASDTTPRMRVILQGVFHRADVDTGKMSEYGMNDAQRDQIVFETNARFNDLVREVERGDVLSGDTLASLSTKLERLRA